MPTVTTDKAGFGQWAKSEGLDSLADNGVAVVSRGDEGYTESAGEIASEILRYMKLSKSDRCKAADGAAETASRAEWEIFIEKYKEAFATALKNAEKREHN